MLKKMGILRGVNLGGWLSQCNYSEERIQHFIEKEDIANIASWGLDHVRIPVDYNVLETEAGEPLERGFERLDWAVAECRKHGLKVVIDLHKTAGYSFDVGEKQTGFFENEALQERFCCLWERIAKRYGAMSDDVVFELLNEVTHAAYCETWNGIADTAIRRIRVYAPNTFILVGSYHHNAAHAVKDLRPPQDDRVIYNFHCYEPLDYTHQGAPWVPQFDQSARIAFRECGASAAFFSERWASAIEAAEKNHTSLYCGEYGVIDVVDPADALEWFKAINAAFEKHGIARAAWSYKQMDFGLSDARWDGLRDELVKYL